MWSYVSATETPYLVYRDKPKNAEIADRTAPVGGWLKKLGGILSYVETICWTKCLQLLQAYHCKRCIHEIPVIIIADRTEARECCLWNTAKGLIKKWRLRWFVLPTDKSVLHYYRTPTSPLPLGEIDLLEFDLWLSKVWLSCVDGSILDVTFNCTLRTSIYIILRWVHCPCTLIHAWMHHTAPVYVSECRRCGG